MNTKYDELFCLLSRQYDLTPLQAEMDEIITACSPFYAAEIARLEAEKAELLEFVQNLGSPKRGSAEEAWDYFEASQLARALARKYGKK